MECRRVYLEGIYQRSSRVESQVRCSRCGELISTQGKSSPIQCQCGQIVAGERDEHSGDAEIPREFWMLLTPEHLLRDRIDQDAFSHFLAVFGRAVKEYEGAVTGDTGADLQVGCALLPDGRKLLDIQTSPQLLDLDQQDLLQRKLDSCAAPKVQEGPVAFVCRFRLWGGSTIVEPRFRLPFGKLAASWSGGLLDEILMKASGLKSASTSPALEPPASLWQRLKRWCRQVFWEESRAPLQETPIEQPDVPVPETLTAADLDSLIEQEPDQPAWYKLRAEIYKEQNEYDKALSDLEAVVALEPKAPEGFLLRGEVHCLNGSMEKGLADFSQAIELDSSLPGSYHARGLIYLELQGWDHAIEDFTMALAQNDTHLNSYLSRAKAHMGRRDWLSAIDDLSQVLEIDPNHPEAFVLRALSRRHALDENGLDREELDRILDDYAAAIRITPSNSWCYVHRAEVGLVQDDYTSAIEDCTKAIDLDPEFGLAFGIRGLAHHQAGDNDEAEADCTKAIELGLRSADVFLARALVLESEGEHFAALEDCDAALAIHPNHAGALNGRGIVRMKLNEFEEAIEDFTHAIEEMETWPVPYANRGNTYRMIDESDKAIEDYGTALELDSTLVPAYLNRAMTFYDIADFESARADFDEAIRQAPDLAQAYFGRSLVLLEQSENEAALQDLNATIELDPECAPAYYNRGNLHLQESRYDLALADFDTLIELNPELGAAYSSRGNVWMQKGEQDKADEDYREAIRCDPESAEEYMVQQIIVEAAFFHRSEDFATAILKASEALEMDAECVPALTLRAASHWYAEQFVEAIDDYNVLIDQAGEGFAAFSGRGQVYAELGEYELALDDLTKAMELGEEESDTLIAYTRSGRALAYTGLGDYMAAQRDFDRSISVCPANAWVHYNHALFYHKRGKVKQAATCFRLALHLSDPALPPRKRKRALAYLDKHPG